MKYRSDIDGLRAFAVLAVILFHASFKFIKGGFIGVDVFFVISGYLITYISLEEIKLNKFSILKFYEKRIRRLFPVLIVVLFLTTLFAHRLLLPYDLKYYYQSLFSTVSFSSNILFFFKSGYFDVSNDIKPLLHTWSLSLEEQFYLLFPFFFIALNKKKFFPWLLMILAIISFSLNILPGRNFSFNFYMLPSRCWELLIGSLLAYKHFFDIKIKFFDNISELFGFFLIITSFFFITEASNHPGWITTIPVFGTLLIINRNKENSITYKFLSLDLFVKIGLVSYSLYLVHQPVFVFLRLFLGRNLNIVESLLGIILSFALSFVISKLVETPLRKITFKKNKMAFATMAASFAALAGVGFLGHIQEGMPNRIVSNRPKNFVSTFKPYHVTKNFLANCRPDRKEICKLSNGTSGKILLVGDSHALDYLQPYKEFLDKNNFTGFISIAGGCSLFIDSTDGECLKVRNETKALLKLDKLNKIIYIENFEERLTLKNISPKNGSKLLQDYLQQFNPIDTYVFIPRVSYIESITYWGLSPLINLNDSFKATNRDNGWEQAYTDVSLSLKNIKFYDERKFLCEKSVKETCSPIEKLSQLPLYRDSNHLTIYGAETVFNNFIEKKIF